MAADSGYRMRCTASAPGSAGSRVPGPDVRRYLRSARNPSGMHWPVPGATAILTQRRQQAGAGGEQACRQPHNQAQRAGHPRSQRNVRSG